jgi:hypothetical protein
MYMQSDAVAALPLSIAAAHPVLAQGLTGDQGFAGFVRELPADTSQ